MTTMSREPRGTDYRPDAFLEIRGPDGARALILVEAKARLTAADTVGLVPRLALAVQANKAAGSLVVANYMSPIARARLASPGVSYLDLTGNVRLSVDRPALFIESSGADRDPSPRRRESRSLKGASAARIVRALCDWKPPVGVRELAGRAAADPGYVTRILTLLQKEDVVARDNAGKVTTIRWKDLLQRWSQDYSVARTNRMAMYLEPRGTDALLKRLSKYSERWALTGSSAVPQAAAKAPVRMLSCYVDNIEEAAAELSLRSVEAGSNVRLLEPFDTVVWERNRKEAGLACVAVSQCAIDLLTGTGREPSEAEALLGWMERNEDDWRL